MDIQCDFQLKLDLLESLSSKRIFKGTIYSLAKHQYMSPKLNMLVFYLFFFWLQKIQFSLVAQSCPTLYLLLKKPVDHWLPYFKVFQSSLSPSLPS